MHMQLDLKKFYIILKPLSLLIYVDVMRFRDISKISDFHLLGICLFRLGTHDLQITTPGRII